MKTNGYITNSAIDALDSFYCENVVAGLWADAVGNRLEGAAMLLLSDDLQEISDDARTAAKRLADRIGDLGGAVTADPGQFVHRSPGEVDFVLPDCSDALSARLVVYFSPHPSASAAAVSDSA